MSAQTVLDDQELPVENCATVCVLEATSAVAVRVTLSIYVCFGGHAVPITVWTPVCWVVLRP